MTRGGDQSRTAEPATSLTALYRRPRAQPLATVVASLILATFAYQAYVTAQQTAWWAGILVLAAGYLAYRIARVGWQLENDYIDAQLAIERLEGSTSQEQLDDSPPASK